MDKKILKLALHNINSKLHIKENEKSLNILLNNFNVDINKMTDINFSNYTTKKIYINKKPREINKYEDPFSPENILSNYLLIILKHSTNIKLPSRKKISNKLFDNIKYLNKLSNFAIYKFDFKDFYNSVSSELIFNNYLQYIIKTRFDYELMKKYTTEVKKTYTGLCLSNLLVEIISSDFDDILKQEFSNYGLFFYTRYIDDTILIFNKYISEDLFNKILDDTIKKVFTYESKLDVNTNKSKFNFIIRNKCENKDIDFLGYKFQFNFKEHQKDHIKYGISTDKIKKHRKKISKITNLYAQEYIDETLNEDYNNIELFRQRILNYSCRQVYVKSSNNRDIWIDKGFISDYSELRYLLLADPNYLIKDTLEFLEKGITDEVDSQLNKINKQYTDIYFLKDSNDKSKYNLSNNMKNNSTLLFHEKIGYSKKSLINLYSKIETINESNEFKKTYEEILNSYNNKINKKT